jgi:thiol-disulfide isomerase/thioredoxin
MVKLRRKTNKRNKLLRRKKTMRLKIKGGNNKVTIIMMWMKGCGHCVLLKETWLLLKEELKDVIFIDMEANKLDHKLLHKYNISVPQGYPTLVKIKNGTVYDEPLGRDIDVLKKWIKS